MPTYLDRSGNGARVDLSNVRTSRSGSITAGGAAQTLAAANGERRRLEGQNISAADLWINDNGGAAAVDGTDSYRVATGETFVTSGRGAVSIIGATTGQKFTAFEE